MEADQAQTIAERVHVGERDPDGTPVLVHVVRVVRATPAEARAVAWLHEVLERGAVTEHELLADGLSSDELRALRLVTSPSWTRSGHAYLGHIDLIARAAGPSGELARTVKLADVRDGCLHPRESADGWSPPYAEGLRRLRATSGRRRLAAAAAASARPLPLHHAGAASVGTA
jgi:hypothetical protein